MRALLVLRPEPGATATARRIAARGLEAIAAPLFTIVPTEWDAPDPAAHDALMLTSANAVRCAGARLADYGALPCYVVGAATAQAARDAGLCALHVGDADADALLAMMARDGIVRPLHLAGRDHRLAAAPGITITRRTVYAAEAADRLPDRAAAAAREAVALIHSPRAGALYADLLRRAGIAPTAVRVAAISAAAAAGWADAAIAARPDDEALIDAAIRHAGA